MFYEGNFEILQSNQGTTANVLDSALLELEGFNASEATRIIGFSVPRSFTGVYTETCIDKVIIEGGIQVKWDVEPATIVLGER